MAKCIMCGREFIFEILGDEVEPFIPICPSCGEKIGKVLLEIPLNLAKAMCKYKQ